MTADIDLNSKDLLNVQNLNATTLYLGGALVAPSDLSVVAGKNQEEQTATALQTVFTMASITYDSGINALSVFINGVLQSQADYTETSSTVVTFTTGLNLGDRVVFLADKTQTVNIADAVSVPYTPGGTGAAVTNVAAELSANRVRTYDSVAEMASDVSAITQDFHVCILSGRSSANDGGAGIWDAVDATGVTEDEFGIVTGDASVSFVLRTAHQVNVLQYGVPVTDASFQAAIDANSVLRVPAGTHSTTVQIPIDKPFILYGDGDGNDSASTNLTAGVTTISCSAAAGAFLVKSGTGNNYLYGVQVTGMHIDCKNTGAIGIHMSSASRCKIDMVTVSRCTADGILLDDANGVVATYNHIDRYRYNSGANAACAASNGLRMHSTYSAGLGGVVQTVCENITSFVEDGDGIKFTGADNNIILKAQGFVNGSGNAVNFATGTYRQSRNNTIIFLAGGPVAAGASSWGNRIVDSSSESGSITIASGGHLHYETRDYVSGELYKTHSYKISDEFPISSSQMFPDGTNAVHAIHALRWASIAFADSVTGIATVNIPAPYSWGTGDITEIELIYSSDTANTTDNFGVTLKVSADGEGDTTSTADADQAFTAPVNDLANRVNKYTAVLSSPVAYTRGDILTLRLERDGASDSAAGDMELLGIRVRFEGDGPTAGSFDIPPVSV